MRDSTPSTSPHGPLTQGRIVALDVLRGVAVFGILVVNVEQLLIPMYMADSPVGVLPGEVGAAAAWFITDFLFESKFLTVFSLLFGAGFCLQWMRFQAAGRTFVGIYSRRLVALAAFGVVHATFFYYADILVVYALTGAVLLLFRNRSSRAMIRAGAIMLTVMTLWHALLSGPDPGGAEHHREIVRNLASLQSDGSVTLGDSAFTTPVPDAVVASHLTGDIHSVDEAIAQTLAWRFGPTRLAIRARLVMFSELIYLFTPLFLLWRTLGLFLIAAGLVKSGFLDAAHRSTWKRVAAIGFVTGVPMSVASSLITLASYTAPGPIDYLAGALHDVSALLIAAAVSTTVLLLCSGRAIGPVGRAFAAVGRLALTNYIGQSVVMTFVATSIGFGMFARLGRMEMLLLCVPVFAFQALASLAWTQFFRMGPLEWIWRGVTYRELTRNRLR